MSIKKTAPYGTWKSPVTSTEITSDAVGLDEIRTHLSGTYWLERRPNEQGRCVIVRHYSGSTEDVIPPPYNARSRVHEYGGGVYCISDDGLYFVNDNDQDIYFCPTKGKPSALTQHNKQLYADLFYDIYRRQLLCVSQQDTGLDEPSNSLVSIDISTGASYTLCSGYDFYSNPRLSPCGKKLSWLCWNHPDMPWDSTELWLAEIDSNNRLSNQKKIAGGNNVSIFQPEWSPSGILTFVSDQNRWWNLFQYKHDQVIALTNEFAEFGQPQWVFGQSSYAYIDSKKILCTHIKKGKADLSILDTETSTLDSLNTPWNSFSSIRAQQDCLWFIAASSTHFPEIVSLQHHSNKPRRVHSSNTTEIDNAYFSYAKNIEFITRHGDIAYAFYYAPCNKEFHADTSEKPPLIVLTHGGPTAMSDSSLDMRKQFWTSRGFAILDVNYSGSTGFGRDYRERLTNNWGIRDAHDCCDAALHMVELGLADDKRLIIKGSSAGGYTVLCALAFHDVFSAGASYYGIGDLESLLNNTHKFEAHYLDKLVGPYPESKYRYIQRSPLHHVSSLNCPVIFFQGLEDKVVPREQAEKMFHALDEKGIPVAYVAFDGEQHGFRKAETIERALNAELYFYSRVLNLPLKLSSDIEIKNIEPAR